MRSIFVLFAILAVCSFNLTLVGQQNWPQFRGQQASGVGSGSPPVKWNVETGENVKWKTKIEGLGHSSPIVWENRIYLTTAINAKTETPNLQTGWVGGSGKAAEDQGVWTWQIICLDINNGKKLWSKDVVQREPTIKRHLKASHANCTPATDGKHVVAFFGSEGLYCFDTDGTKLWEKNFGRLHSGPYNAKELEWGFASSPIIYKNRVIVQCDCLNTGFVAVLDVATGEELLRIQREDVATWSTPIVVETKNRTQIVCNGYKQMAGYEFRTGRQLWTLSGGGDVPVPTPLFANDLIFLTNGHSRSPTYAISPTADGDLTPVKDSDELPDGLVWWHPQDGSYMPTPIVVDQLIYTCNDNGRLTVRDAKTGELVYKKRVSAKSGTYSASAVAAGDHLYFSGEKGDVIVVKTGREYELVAENTVGDVLMATPAISGNQLLIRTVKQLYCFETEEK